MDTVIVVFLIVSTVIAIWVMICVCIPDPNDKGKEYRIMMNGYDKYRAEHSFINYSDGIVWRELSKWNRDIDVAVKAIDKEQDKRARNRVYKDVGYIV